MGYTPNIPHLKVGYNPLILTIDPNFPGHPSRDKEHFFHHQRLPKTRGSPTDRLDTSRQANSQFGLPGSRRFDGGWWWRWTFGGSRRVFFGLGEGWVGWSEVPKKIKPLKHVEKSSTFFDRPCSKSYTLRTSNIAPWTMMIGRLISS